MNYYWQSAQIPFSPMPWVPMPGYSTPYDTWGMTRLTADEELDMLKGQAELLEDELDGITGRIKELEGGKK
jgi:hypothetical protein